MAAASKSAGPSSLRIPPTASSASSSAGESSAPAAGLSTNPRAGRGLCRLKLRKALFISHPSKPAKDCAPRCAINDQFNPIDVPSSLPCPRSPAKAWKLLGIPSHQYSPSPSPGRTPTTTSRPSTRPSTADNPRTTPLLSSARRPALGRLYTTSGVTGAASRPIAGAGLCKLANPREYSVSQAHLGPAPRISTVDSLACPATRPGLLRSVSAHPIRPRRDYQWLAATPPTPARSVPLAYTPLARDTIDASGYELEEDSIPHAALRSALFKASIDASNLSHLGSSVGSTRSPSRASSHELNPDSAWPPTHLVSHFSDATSTAAQSMLSLAESGSAKYGHLVNTYAADDATDQLSRLEVLEKIVADANDPNARLKIAEWCTQFRNDLRTPHTRSRSRSRVAPFDPDDVATAMVALHARTPRRSLSLPQLIRSNSSDSAASSYGPFHSPTEGSPVSKGVVRSRQSSGSTADDHLALGYRYVDERGGWAEENGRIEETRRGSALGFEWLGELVD